MKSAWTLLLRGSAVVIGMTGISWGVSERPGLRQESTISKIAEQIIAGDAFKLEILLGQASAVESTTKPEGCRPLMVRGAAIIRLRLAEMSSNPDLDPFLVRTNSAIDAIRSSLECSPADSFLWLVLSALEPTSQLSYLTASYRLGRNEGWIAVKRNPVAFAEFDELSEDLRATVVQEFLGILKMDLYDDAMKIFVGPAWEKKDLILSQIDHVPLRQRQNLAVRLAAAGYDVMVPGTTLDVTQ